MDKVINIIVVVTFLLFVLFIIFVAGISSNFQGYTCMASNVALSSKKIEWGIQRKNNHEQPSLGDVNKRIIEEFNGMAIGNNQKPYIYLTFDVGYEGGYTEKILDILKENQVPAAFFITGQFVKTNPEIIQRMINEGHIVGNHAPKFLMAGFFSSRKLRFLEAIFVEIKYANVKNSKSYAL